MEVQVLGAHSLESADVRLTSLLIDEVLALDAGSLASSLSFSAQRKLKAILLTHQHFDHIRDIPMIGMSFTYWGSVKVYSISAVLDALSLYFLNQKLYPDFQKFPPGRPSLEFIPLQPGKPTTIEGYTVMALPMNHPVPAVGYLVSASDGKTIFYTGDTGMGLSSSWKYVAPQLLIVEVSGPNDWGKIAHDAQHLTPGLLKEELTKFRLLKGYLPSILAVHLNPFLESKTKEELEQIAFELGAKITLAKEGMRLSV